METASSPNERGRLFLETGLSLALLSAPLAFGLVYAWGYGLTAALLFLLLGLFPEALFKTFRLSLFPASFFLLLAGFVSWQAVFISYDRYSSLGELLKWFAWAALFSLVQLLSQKALLRLLGILVFLGILETAYGLWQAGSGNESILWQAKDAHFGYVTGTYLNRNHLAAFLEMSLGVLTGFLGRALKERRLLGTFSLLFFWGAMAAVLFLTGSRMGMASFLPALAVFIFFLSVRFSFKKAALLGGVLVSLALIIFWSVRPVLEARLQDVFANRGALDGGRLLVWKSTWQMVKDHAWTGTGLGTFEWAFPAYQPPSLSMGWAHAHNDFLELLAGLGGAGFSLLFFLFSFLFGKILKELDPRKSKNFLLEAGILLGLFSFLIHSLADFNFAIPGNALTFIFLSAVLWRFRGISLGEAAQDA